MSVLLHPPGVRRDRRRRMEDNRNDIYTWRESFPFGSCMLGKL